MSKANKYDIYINTKHGHLLIQKITGSFGQCLCDCGKLTTHTVLKRVIDGKITMCKSCSNKLNGDKGRTSRSNTSKYNKLIGKTIFYFTVLRRANTEEPCGTFVCQCICGNIRYIDGYELTKSKDRKSCGCQQSRLLSLSQGGTGIAHEKESINEFIRKDTKEYTQWTTTILTNNDYTCFISGKRGGPLNVHHIISLTTLITLYEITKENYKNYEAVLFNTNNGIVLTEKLHKKFHAIYGKYATLENLLEFKIRYLASSNSK